jgi:hypothetical protein
MYRTFFTLFYDALMCMRGKKKQLEVHCQHIDLDLKQVRKTEADFINTDYYCGFFLLNSQNKLPVDKQLLIFV